METGRRHIGLVGANELPAGLLDALLAEECDVTVGDSTIGMDESVEVAVLAEQDAEALEDSIWNFVSAAAPVGVVLIGTERKAFPLDASLGYGPDSFEVVWLPAEVSLREVVNTCRLLAEVVRLRRAQRLGQEHRQRLTDLAYTDPVTGLANRRAWDEELVRRLASQNGGGCLAIFDIDRFKLVNDTFGHATGDRVLCAVSESLRESVRDVDFVARLGGDEFGVLLEWVGETQGGAIVDRIRAQVAAAKVQLEGAGDGDICVTASAGWTPIERSATSAAPLFAAADQALQRAKSTGRNRTIRG